MKFQSGPNLGQILYIPEMLFQVLGKKIYKQGKCKTRKKLYPIKSIFVSHPKVSPTFVCQDQKQCEIETEFQKSKCIYILRDRCLDILIAPRTYARNKLSLREANELSF